MWHFSLAMTSGVVTSVNFNTVQVTNMTQLHRFVLEDCHKSCFTLRGNFRQMEAHSTCTSGKKSGSSSFIEMSWLFLMSLSFCPFTVLELNALQPWLVRAARESDCKVSDRDVHVWRAVIRSEGRVRSVCSFLLVTFYLHAVLLLRASRHEAHLFIGSRCY